jgi:hypothetical protein
MNRFVALGALLVPASFSFGQTYLFTLDQKQSSVQTSLALEAPLEGTLIGDFDAETNPTGTKTLPGLFGGSGNNPIPYSATISAGGDLDSPPSGGFTAAIDLRTLTVQIDGLSIDLLGGESFGIGLTLTILYDTFRTQQPTSLYIGGFPLPIPLGNLLEVTALTADQSGLGVGALVEMEPGVYSFNAVVPVDLSATILLQGAPVGDGAPIPAALPIVGTLDLNANPPTITATAASEFAQELPIDPPLSFDAQAVDLPTILPPGNTAHLLFGGAISTIGFSFGSDITLVALGETACARLTSTATAWSTAPILACCSARGTPAVRATSMAMASSTVRTSACCWGRGVW